MTVVKRQYDDIIQELQKRVRSLESEIRVLKEMRRPAIPIYDYNDLPVGFDGQIALIENVPEVPIP